MIISRINKFNNDKLSNLQSAKSNQTAYNNAARFNFALQTGPITDVFNKTNPPINVSFIGGLTYISQSSFATKFPKTFFKKLAEEILPCAYTGIEMIPRSQYDALRESQVLNKRSALAIKFLKKFKKNFVGIEKDIFNILETEAKKHPNLKLQEILQLKYPSAEKTLITQQSNVLNKINLVARNLPKEDFLQVRKIVQTAFDKIFAQEPQPEERFRRKDFLFELKNLKIKTQKDKDKIIQIAEKLPSSTSSISAFIVKYSQPYKLKFDNNNIIKTTRDSEELALRLLRPFLATDEHIYPQTLYNKEMEKKLSGNPNSIINDNRVTILTCEFINGEKTDILLDNFIKSSEYNIPENIQKHIDRLIQIDNIWMKKGRIADAAKLADYITELKSEFERRSKFVRVDTSELDKILPDISAKYKEHMQKMKLKKQKKQTPTKSTKNNDNAANSHGEHYTSSDGKVMKNRKHQRHSSRFSK